MQPAASPRHPWKALAVVLLVFAAVHGAGAHAGLGDHDGSHIRVVHADRDCERIDIDIDDNDGPDDDPVIDVFDGDDWS
jgi:hypothetical protein